MENNNFEFVNGKYSIDFFELMFLAEACIPPVPIARGCFWKDLIDIHYNKMSQSEKKRAYQWISERENFKRSINNGDEDCKLFEARFNPDNQYKITVIYDEKISAHEAFLLDEEYHVNSKTRIDKEYIKEVLAI
jgi:hypothetical protein